MMISGRARNCWDVDFSNAADSIVDMSRLWKARNVKDCPKDKPGNRPYRSGLYVWYRGIKL